MHRRSNEIKQAQTKTFNIQRKQPTYTKTFKGVYKTIKHKQKQNSQTIGNKQN